MVFSKTALKRSGASGVSHLKLYIFSVPCIWKLRNHNLVFDTMLLCTSLQQAPSVASHVDDERTYHVGIKVGTLMLLLTTDSQPTQRGDVAPRILSVGSARRAYALSMLLHPLAGTGHSSPHIIESSRGFLTTTGSFSSSTTGISAPVSIICTHMGAANMDFVIRECATVIDGPMAVIRVGTCGGLHADLEVGTVVVCSPGSLFVRYAANLIV